MSSKKRFHGGAALAACLTFLVAAHALPAQEMDEEAYRAWAVNMTNIHPGGTTTLQIHINRWSTDEERQKLFGALVEKGREEPVRLMEVHKQ